MYEQTLDEISRLKQLRQETFEALEIQKKFAVMPPKNIVLARQNFSIAREGAIESRSAKETYDDLCQASMKRLPSFEEMVCAEKFNFQVNNATSEALNNTIRALNAEINTAIDKIVLQLTQERTNKTAQIGLKSDAENTKLTREVQYIDTQLAEWELERSPQAKGRVTQTKSTMFDDSAENTKGQPEYNYTKGIDV